MDHVLVEHNIPLMMLGKDCPGIWIERLDELQDPGIHGGRFFDHQSPFLDVAFEREVGRDLDRGAVRQDRDLPGLVFQGDRKFRGRVVESLPSPVLAGLVIGDKDPPERARHTADRAEHRLAEPGFSRECHKAHGSRDDFRERGISQFLDNKISPEAGHDEDEADKKPDDIDNREI